MYISSIKIEGFKSFANKIELPLTKHLNIFIGPNGSGKSNVIDALSFLLGESSRNLRADKNVNLIYNGVKNIKEAYVEIVVDLENEKINELEELEENKEGKVTLKRRIKKNGESGYYVNNTKVTKSYFERILSILKLNTPYNIIFQGDITNVVKSSFKEKRKIFEDLAQISVYEEKKNKVIKELESVEIKLSEFKAILNEKEKRVNELKKEKELAEKFLDLQRKKRSLLKAKLIKKIENIKKKINDLNNKELVYKTKLKELKEKKLKIENEIELIKKEIEKINVKIEKEGGKEINEIEEKIRENIKLMESKKAKLELLKKELEELNSFKEKLEIELNDLKKKVLELDNEKSNLFKQYNNLKQELNKYNEIEIDDKSLEELQRQINQIREKLFNLKNERTLITHKINEIKEIFGLNEENNLKDIDKELKEFLSQDSQLASKINVFKQIIKEKEEKLIKLKEEYEEVIRTIKSNKLLKAILDLKEKILGLYGPLFMLGDVEERYRRAIEMAGGNRLKAIVVENEDVAKEVIDYIKQKKLGILSFIPLNRIKEKYLKYEMQEGIIGLAVDLINFDPKFKKAFYYVFGDTLVVKDFDTAKKIGIGKYRMVTLDGELFETSGVISGGYSKRTVSFIDSSIENKINTIENEISEYKSKIEELKKEREKISEKIFELRIKKKEIESKNKEIANLKNYEKKLKEVDELIAKLEVELKMKENEFKEKSNKYKELIEKFKEKESLIQELKEKENAINLIKEKISNYLLQIKEKENLYFSVLKRKEEIKKEEVYLKKEIEKMEKTNEELKRKLYSLKGKVRELFKKKENLFKKINEKSADLINIEEKIQEFDKVFYEIDLNKKLLEEERIELIKEIENIKEEALFVENIEKELNKVNQEIKNFGNVNLKALEIFDEVNKEYLEFKQKVEKILEEKERIVNALTEIEDAKKREFLKVFNIVNQNFQKIHKELMEKGKAWLELTSKENPFEGGVEIIVEIANRRFNLKSLSGGEQTLVALSLIFAIQEFKPGTFYAFDEVDAALDKRNARKLARYLKNYSKKTQFIVISHNEELIVEADYLFGVTMDKKTGISKVVSLDLNENLDIKKLKESKAIKTKA